MPISIKMPALSPTMEEGTLARWLVKEGDTVSSGDLLAEIETDKATMEFEAIDEGTVANLLVDEGAEGVKVGTTIAMLAEEGEDVSEVADANIDAAPEKESETEADSALETAEQAHAGTSTKAEKEIEQPVEQATESAGSDRVRSSPLARRLASEKGVDIASLQGSGPKGRVVKADVEKAKIGTATPDKSDKTTPAEPAEADPKVTKVTPRTTPQTPAETDFDIPHEVEKLSGMRKTIARRLTEAKQTIPHYRVSIDINIDKMLKLRGELNEELAARDVKLSVNDFIIKAQGAALRQVPDCNVSFAGDTLIRFQRADIAVAVSIEGGLITPIVTGADAKSLSAISAEMGDLAARAKDGKLKMHEYQGGTAGLSNMGMFGVTSFDAVINPPQGMILAISAGLKRPVVIDDSVQIATIMTATGSFDHRAIDGATGAAFMSAFKQLVENPIAMLA